MNFRLRQERNFFALFVLIALPTLLLTAPLAYLSRLQTNDMPGHGTQRTSYGADAFVRADRNRDGVIDAEEARFVPGLVPLFGLVDTNGDGRIDRRELARMPAVRARLLEARA
jgi:EF hand domain-containing protein